MRSLASLFIIAGLISYSFLANAQEFIQLPIEHIGSNEAFIKESRPPLMKFFSDLETKGIGRGLYTTPKGFPMNTNPEYLMGMAAIESDIKCEFIFCADTKLKNELIKQKELGRLIFLTHALTGLNGAVLSDEIPSLPAFKNNFPGKNIRLALLLITPNTTLDILKHELVHAEDYESGILIPLKNLVASLSAAGKISSSNANAINTFALEIRAYDRQRIFVETNARETEFDYEISSSDYSGKTVSIPGAVFRESKLRSIDDKVRRIYLPRALSALNETSEADRKTLNAVLLALMPSTGPYSYSSLMVTDCNKALSE